MPAEAFSACPRCSLRGSGAAHWTKWDEAGRCESGSAFSGVKGVLPRSPAANGGIRSTHQPVPELCSPEMAAPDVPGACTSGA